MQRRAFLGTAVLSVSGAQLGCNEMSEPERFTSDAGAPAPEYFPQSVASGDPRPTSVVLWTRAIDPDAASPLSVRLELALDADFTEVMRLGPELLAREENDHCVRVRVEDLKPATTYYYRFSVAAGAGRRTSRTGRTKTAPAPEADVAPHFAVMSCQDYSGRYYHALRRAAELDLDFVVHLGDYIYETADDPSFQNEDGERRIVFDDPEGALHVTPSTGPGGADADAGAQASASFLAARSLDNYRQLYRTYRSDPDLQRLHELFPMICVWDDHEFSDDCYGATATYSDGQKDERDLERRANADQAWTEYTPIDFPAGPDFQFDPSGPFPDNLRIYRSFEFGQHLLLLMTDLRRYRSDHVIAEDAFPAAIALTQERLLALLDEVPDRAVPYVDIDEASYRELRDELMLALDRGTLAGSRDQIAGPLDVAFINDTLDALGSSAPRIDASDTNLARGVPYSAVGKTDPYASFGARYFVDYEVFGWIARARYEDSAGASEQMLGHDQEGWFTDTLTGSDRTWKVWGCEFALMQQRADLRGLPVPEAFARELLISTDDWDGMPNRRTELLAQVQNVDNLVAVTGDLHSFFAGSTGTPFGDRVIEFMCGAVSSATYRSILEGAGFSVPGLDLGVAAGLLLEAANPHMAYEELLSNGFAEVEVSASALRVTFHQIPFDELRQQKLAGNFDQHFHTERFRVKAGSARIERDFDGAWKHWDEASKSWV